VLVQVDNVAHWGDILQMAVLELIRKVCRANPAEKGKYIKIILALLQSTSTAVVYECAVTLVSLSNAPTAITAAANCYCQMLVSQSDNNVKLIVLDRLQVGPKLVCITLFPHLSFLQKSLGQSHCLLAVRRAKNLLARRIKMATAKNCPSCLGAVGSPIYAKQSACAMRCLGSLPARLDVTDVDCMPHDAEH